MRSISRVCDVSINTVSKLLADPGKACAAFHDENVNSFASRPKGRCIDAASGRDRDGDASAKAEETIPVLAFRDLETTLHEH
jgi:hypothetical protein